MNKISMIREIEVGNRKIKYNLHYKKVKNINLRIKPDGKIYVSADTRVPQKLIDDFLISKVDFIFRAVEKYEKASDMKLKQYFSEEQVVKIILDFCNKAYPYYEKMGIQYPVIKFRRMTSRWGSCNVQKGILTFNINLMFTPIECIEYVVHHEFTHFLQPNHSENFYAELEKVCPNWKECRKILKNDCIY